MEIIVADELVFGFCRAVIFAQYTMRSQSLMILLTWLFFNDCEITTGVESFKQDR